MTSPDFVFFSPREEGVAVCVVIGGVLQEVTVWRREAAMNHCVTLLNYISEIDRADDRKEPGRAAAEIRDRYDALREDRSADG